MVLRLVLINRLASKILLVGEMFGKMGWIHEKYYLVSRSFKFTNRDLKYIPDYFSTIWMRKILTDLLVIFLRYLGSRSENVISRRNGISSASKYNFPPELMFLVTVPIN